MEGKKLSIFEKIENCKEQIKHTKLKKEGRNAFSKYDYFTPEQIEKLVYEATKENRLLTKFNLKRNEFGVYGEYVVIDLDTSEKEVYEMATAIPEIKATNIAQQLGGCVTYTERYLKMSVFGIVENSLDFDDKDNKSAIEGIKANLANCSSLEELTDLYNLKFPNGAGYTDSIKVLFVKRKSELS